MKASEDKGAAKFPKYYFSAKADPEQLKQQLKVAFENTEFKAPDPELIKEMSANSDNCYIKSLLCRLRFWHRN